jgi:nicotinamidase-related amidase
MPQTLHGSVPDDADVALLLIDVINDLEFDTGAALLEPALAAGRNIAMLKRRAREVGVPAIYVNDNFGRWRSDFRRLVAHCLEDGVRGEPLARLLVPDDQDYFVLKPKHSGFFGTSLQVLLEHLGARTLIVTGITTDMCVLFTAQDAYLRDYGLAVPGDCVASHDTAAHARSLLHMSDVLRANVRSSSELALGHQRSAAPGE